MVLDKAENEMLRVVQRERQNVNACIYDYMISMHRQAVSIIESMTCGYFLGRKRLCSYSYYVSVCRNEVFKLSLGMPQKNRIEDVAQAAGVSTATVSRALSQPGRVSRKTRDLVHAAVDRLGYVPNAAGRALASGRTQTIGCVIPTLDSAIFARSTHAMQLAFADAGYQLLVASHNYDMLAEAQLIQTLQHRGVDALILVGAQHHTSAWTTIKRWTKPTLLTWVCDERLPSVGFDNLAIAATATSHLWDLGHRNIGMISGYVENNDRAGQQKGSV
jgi:LacI family transcriptional regulator